MKALVTGAAGFIGSHIAEALLAKGHDVIGLDILEVRNAPNLKPMEPFNGKGFTYLAGDICDRQVIERALPGVDWVFHSAAVPSVPRSVAEPLETNKVNLDATLQLLEACREQNVRRYVFASSSAIYGDNPAPSKNEGLEPAPISPYGLQKYAAERYGQLFHSLYGLTTVNLRYFNVFGPRQAYDSPYSGVIAKFCCAMLEGKAPAIYGDGRQSRDFTYVENVVAANLRAVEAEANQVGGKVFNIATGGSITLLDLVAELNRLTGQDLAPSFQPERPGDIRHSKADIAAAQSDLGYRIQVPWKEGLKKTLEWYRSWKTPS